MSLKKGPQKPGRTARLHIRPLRSPDGRQDRSPLMFLEIVGGTAAL
jgi:hypothetical protein